MPIIWQCVEIGLGPHSSSSIHRPGLGIGMLGIDGAEGMFVIEGMGILDIPFFFMSFIIFSMSAFIEAQQSSFMEPQ